MQRAGGGCAQQGAGLVSRGSRASRHSVGTLWGAVGQEHVGGWEARDNGEGHKTEVSQRLQRS